MLLLLLPLLNSSSVKNLLRPFSKDKSSSSAEDGTACPICQATPTIPFIALPCQHRYISGYVLSISLFFAGISFLLGIPFDNLEELITVECF